MEISGAQLCTDLKQVRKKILIQQGLNSFEFVNLFCFFFFFSMGWRIQISGEPSATPSNSSKLLFPQAKHV